MVKGNGGSVSPIGQQSVKCKKELTISYEKDNDYQFIEWQFFIDDKLLTAEEASEYICFENSEKDLTTLKFLKEVPGKTIVKPLCYERPVILGKTPTETPEGSYRDARISILFSKAIDESSVFYDSINDLPSGAEPKYIDNNPGNKIYGYILDGVTYFKNIEIKNIDTDENLLGCYSAPYFESATRLCIPVLKNKEPKGGSQILVNISKNMCSKIEGKSVSLAKNEIWNYVVNSKTDSDVPMFESIELKKYNYGSTELKNLSHSELSGTFTIQLINDLYLSENYLGLIIKCKDLGSGLNSAQLKMQRVYDSNYNPVNDSNVEEFPLQLTYTSGKNKALIYEGFADENKPFDVDLKDIKNGIYKIWFKVTDSNGNSIDSINDKALEDDSMKYFYVLKTDTAAQVTTFKAIPQNNGVKLKLPDEYAGFFQNATVKYSNKTNTNIEQNITKTIDIDSSTENIFTLTDLTDGNLYDINVTFTDIFNNSTQDAVKKEIMTAPAAPVVYKTGVYNGPKIDYECQKFYQDPEYFNINEVTDYYGRGVELISPETTGEYAIKFKVYDGENVIQDNITSNKFDLAYSSTEGKKEYRMASYILYENEIIEGPKSEPFIYHERNVDGIFIDTVYSTQDRFGIVAGFIISKNNSHAGTEHRFAYGKWERYMSKNGEIYKTYKAQGYDFTTDPLMLESANYIFYYRRDICIKDSLGSSYVYKMKKNSEDNADTDVLFGFTFKKIYAERQVQFLWDGYTVQ